MSSDLIETRLSQISDRIRKGRENKHLTLVELGLRSGVAPSTIQKIENRQMTPSIVVILKIAAGLGLEGGDLIAPPNPSPRDTIIQRKGQHARIVVSKALMFEKLSADILGSELECWRIVIAAGHEMKLSSPAAMGEQIRVLRARAGRTRVREPGLSPPRGRHASLPSTARTPDSQSRRCGGGLYDERTFPSQRPCRFHGGIEWPIFSCQRALATKPSPIPSRRVRRIF